MSDYLEHKNGYKYIDKYRSKSGKWVYLYKKPGHMVGEKDMFGNRTEYQTPDTKVYFRDSNKLLSSRKRTQAISSGGKATVNEYRERGRIERAYDNAPRNISRGINEVQKTTKRTVRHVRDFSSKTINRGRNFLQQRFGIKW